MIEIQNLTKSYGKIQALREISCTIREGEIVGLLGPNGAGKTTAIKTLTGYLQPGGGTVYVNGLNVLTHPQEVQACIGYLPESAPLYPELSVQGYLRMIANMRKIPRSQQIDHISEAVYATALENHLTRPIAELSKGFRQRVGLAQAILHRPKLLILDEPTVGLDPTQIVEIRRLIKRLAKNSTILFSTHILSEVEAVCDRVIIIMNGEIRADARMSELSGSADAVLILQEKVPGLEQALRGIKGVETVKTMNRSNGHPAYRIQGKDNVDLCPEIYRLASSHSWPVRELRYDRQTLETVFNQLATGA